jgi:hypothetical protein
MITDKQWESVKTRTDKLREAYLMLGQLPNANVNFALQMVIDPLLKRYDSGERTQSLFDEMMELE